MSLTRRGGRGPGHRSARARGAGDPASLGRDAEFGDAAAEREALRYAEVIGRHVQPIDLYPLVER